MINMLACSSLKELSGSSQMLEGGAVSICIAIVEGVFTVAAVGLGGWIALRSYFREKEYELVKQRYLEGSIDVIASELEHAFGVMHHNWARSLGVVRAYRDQQADFDVGELSRGFLPLDASKFERIAHARLQRLLGSAVIWHVYQLAMAHYVHANAVVTKEIPDTIRLRLSTDRIRATDERTAHTAFEALRRLNEEGHRYAILTEELQNPRRGG